MSEQRFKTEMTPQEVIEERNNILRNIKSAHIDLANVERRLESARIDLVFFERKLIDFNQQYPGEQE